MKKHYQRLLVLSVLFVVISLLCSSCNNEASGANSQVECEHYWKSATCEKPAKCTECGETKGEALGHTWVDATCIQAKVCSVCALSDGEALGHTYSSEITSKASCIDTGVKTYTCDVCADTYTEEFEKEKYDSTELFEMYEKAVGEVLTYDKSGKELALGSCFVYSSNGIFVTNYHVIEDAYSAKITIDGKNYGVKKVLAYDKDIDIAILATSAKDLPEIELCKNTHKSGSKVYALGSSKGLTATFSQGMITHANREIDGIVYTQHDAAISSGNSGGPLINEHGEVIGINTWTVTDSQNLNFAINISEIDNLDFSSPLTMSELYEKECNAFKKIVNYAKQYGDYDYEDNQYVAEIGYNYNNGTSFTRLLYYNIDSNDIQFVIYVDAVEYWVSFTVDENLSGEYFWIYLDDFNYEMYGTLYANTYTDDTLLGYTYNNVGSSLRPSIRELASSLMSLLVTSIELDLAELDITVYDLGFIRY